MSIINLTGLAVSESSYRRARQIVNDKPEGRKTGADVLASLRAMMPGWTITTCESEWGTGGRNVEISQSLLERMAEDADAMVRYKALLLDLEVVAPEIEAWKQENPGQYLEFGLEIHQEGVRAMAMIRTLLGGETRTTFELTGESPTWGDLIRQKLNSLSEGQVYDAEGNRSWVG